MTVLLNVNILQEKELKNKILKTEIKENSVIANLFVFVFIAIRYSITNRRF